MRYYWGTAAVLMLVLVQTSALPLFSLFGGRPDLLLVLLLAWMLARGVDDALPMVTLAGVTLGLLSGGPAGVPLLALALVSLVALSREAHLVQADVLALIVGFVATLVYQFAFLVAAFMGARTVGWGDAFGSAMLPTAIIDAILTVPAYRAMTLTVRPGIRRVLA